MITIITIITTIIIIIKKNNNNSKNNDNNNNNNINNHDNNNNNNDINFNNKDVLLSEHHLLPDRRISGYEEPGSYVVALDYALSLENTIRIVDASISCKQYLSWKCTGARMKVRHQMWCSKHVFWLCP